MYLKIVFQNKILDADSNQALKLDFALGCHFSEVNIVSSNHAMLEAVYLAVPKRVGTIKKKSRSTRRDSEMAGMCPLGK